MVGGAANRCWFAGELDRQMAEQKDNLHKWQERLASLVWCVYNRTIKAAKAASAPALSGTTQKEIIMYYVYTRTYIGANPHENLNVDTLHISTVPVLTNSSKEVITEGWAGSTNDWSVNAYGEYASLEEAKAYVEQEFETREVPDCFEENHYAPDGEVEVRLLGKYRLMNDDELGDWISPVLHEIEAGTTDEQIETIVNVWLDECQNEHGSTFCEARAVEYCEERREYEQEQTVEKVKEDLDMLLSVFTDKVCDYLEQNGDTSETCQRQAINNKAYAIQQLINGIAAEDLKKQ